jgi:hypothetical protein
VGEHVRWQCAFSYALLICEGKLITSRLHAAVQVKEHMLNSIRKKIILVEGTIDHIGVATFEKLKRYTFIKINGQMYNNVLVTPFLDSFIRAGATVRVAMLKRGKKHVITALQDEKGDLYKEESVFDAIVMGLMLIGMGLFLAVTLGLCTMAIFPYSLFGSAAILLYCIYEAFATPYLLITGPKALNAQEGVPPTPGFVSA